MAEVILVAFISAGIVTAIQGILVLRGRRRAKPLPFERPLLDVLSPKQPDQRLQILGRLRLVYGIFLFVVGIWGLTGI